MTGAVAAAAYSVIAGGGAPPVTVQLHNQEIDALATGATATAVYVISNTGAVSGTPGGTLETWLTGAGASASSYEVTASQTSGTAVSGTLGAWTNCGTSQTWSLTNSHQNNSVLAAVLSVQIRDVATHTVQASASITLTAESDSRFG